MRSLNIRILMFYGDTIQDTRQLFFTSWQKYHQKQTLYALEEQIVSVIIEHPEYQVLLEGPIHTIKQTYSPEQGQTNPFLHMGLHLAIREQINTDRPIGILQSYKKLLQKYTNHLVVEHLMMDLLAECLWQAQRKNGAPNEANYLSSLAQLSI